MILSIASGKGGTGKTLISTSLARIWANNKQEVTYVDADAEEPNGHLFLKPQINKEQRFFVKVPTLNDKTCDAHGECQKICTFNAILAIKGKVLVFDELCHSCGACILACPSNSLVEKGRDMGTISHGESNGINFISAKLDVGEARVTPLITGVVDQAMSAQDSVQKETQKEQLIIIDSPPGTSCSTMAAIEHADLLLLVTEPTPFGLHDLKLAIDMGRAFGRKLAAVINRSNLGNSDTEKMLKQESVPILAQIPFDRSIAEAYATSHMAIDTCQQFNSSISNLADKISAMMKQQKE